MPPFADRSMSVGSLAVSYHWGTLHGDRQLSTLGNTCSRPTPAVRRFDHPRASNRVEPSSAPTTQRQRLSLGDQPLILAVWQVSGGKQALMAIYKSTGDSSHIFPQPLKVTEVLSWLAYGDGLIEIINSIHLGSSLTNLETVSPE